MKPIWNALSLDYIVCNSWLKIFVSWSNFRLVLKHWRKYFVG